VTAAGDDENAKYSQRRRYSSGRHPRRSCANDNIITAADVYRVQLCRLVRGPWPIFVTAEQLITNRSGRHRIHRGTATKETGPGTDSRTPKLIRDSRSSTTECRTSNPTSLSTVIPEYGFPIK